MSNKERQAFSRVTADTSLPYGRMVHHGKARLCERK